MLACRVVEHLDVVEHILPGLDAGLVGSTPYPLAFEQIEEALRDSIVMAVSPPAVSIIDATASDPYDWRFYRVKEWGYRSKLLAQMLREFPNAALRDLNRSFIDSHVVPTFRNAIDAKRPTRAKVNNAYELVQRLVDRL